MKRLGYAVFGVLLAALVSGVGCELIVAPDRTKIGNGGSGGETVGGGGAGGTTNPGGGGSTSTGGTGGIGGTGGVGGVEPCNTPADCGAPSGPCVDKTCEGNICGEATKAEGSLANTQVLGDCKEVKCDAAGATVDGNDDLDLPDDGNDCTDDVCVSGSPSNPFLMSGEVCMSAGGSLCDGSGACVQCLVVADCPGQDTECQKITCDLGVCGVSNVMQGTATAAQTDGDCKVNQCDGAGSIETIDADDPQDDGNECTTNTCSAGMNVTSNVAVDTACGALGALFCNGNGACVGCTVATQCGTPSNACLVATCDAGGACGTANKADGTTCDDGNACSQTDTCQAGSCTGANPVICSASDQCHDAGTCDSGTGVCDDPAKANGSACSDGDGCTQTDSCQAGSCVGANPVVCSALDQCHVAGTCDSGTGVCDNPTQPNGTTCSDANACTQTDTCQVGACVGANPVVCSALDQCHDVGTCNIGTGVCDNPNKADGTTCSDANACTQTDTCQAGACAGANPVTCTALDQCHDVGTCNIGTGVCDNPLKANGATCDDGDGCTVGDICQAGACSAGTPIVCTALDQCHDAGTCSAGTCSNPIKLNGTTCNDANACTQIDTCQAGACTGANPVVCSALDQCHNVGTCNTTTGICDNPNKGDGTACSDTNACTQTDTCQAGACVGANPVVCTALDQCHDVGTCNTGTGVCDNPAKVDGATCSDGNGCTTGDTCQAGACSSGAPVVCGALDQCHVAGTCAPGTGICDNPNAMDGTLCTVGASPGACAGGTCIAASCSDSIQNGDETAVDCGGGTCADCANGLACLVDGDCLSNHCFGNVCVECTADAQCPGIDDDCQTPVCTGINTCTINFEAPGTPTASGQTTGDCKQVQCNGSGGTMVANFDTDLPVDGNQCTDDVCTTGSPTNPPTAPGTACNQSGVACDGNGNCVAAPEVAQTSPADGAANVATLATIAVTFTVPMNPATLTGQVTAGACSGSIQVTSNDFTSCIAFTTAAATMNIGNTVATLTPLGRLFAGTTYKIRVTTAAQSALNLPLPATFTQPTGFRTVSGADACDGNVVISQVYGGGGNGSAPFQRDFIELHNQGATAVEIGGWSVQFVSAAGTNWAVHPIVAGPKTLLPAGGYFLIEEATGGAVGAVLPTPDLPAVGAGFAMGATSGKVILVKNSTPLPIAACPITAAVVDIVGYGTTATCFEGTGPTPAPSNTTAVLRGEVGCADTNANNTNFTAGVPNPRNSASAAATCTCNAVANELNTAAEADFCNLQFPPAIPIPPATTQPTGTPTPNTFGRVFETGTTTVAGAQINVISQFGYGPAASDPTSPTSAWLWYPTTFNLQVGSDDEYQRSITAPAVGVYPYTYRVSFDGLQWTYCDIDGAGSNAGLTFSAAQLGSMTVTP